MSRKPLSIAVGAVLLMAGCAAGPDFEKPKPPEVQGYTTAPLAATAAGAQSFVPGAEVSGEWWTLFHSKPLDDLIAQALRQNPDLKAAQAALAAAEETARAQEGGYYPSVSASVAASRNKTSAQLSPTPNSGDLHFDLYTPQVSVTYVPDVFGLNRRSVEFLNAQAEQARFALVATHIALSANVATAAIQAASLHAQIDVTQKLVDDETELLRMLKAQAAAGYASRLDVAAQQAQLAQVAATLPPLQKQLAQEQDLLAALAGAFPGQGGEAEIGLSDLTLPQELPLTLPSELVEQRPDVRQAEANLHAASAAVGIAAANRLPSFTLTADAGAMALAANQIFRAGSGFWTLAGDVTQPLFEGGALEHKEQAAKDAYDQAAEQYKGAVLTAVQNVADSLHAIQADSAALQAAADAKDAADTSLAIARRQWQAGEAGYVSVLSAEQLDQQAALVYVQAEANRYTDTVALFQALGGGWWNRRDLPKD